VIAGFGSVGNAASIVGIASGIANLVASKIYVGTQIAASAALAKKQMDSSQAQLGPWMSPDKASTNGLDFADAAEGIATAIHGMMQAPVLACSDPSTALNLLGSALDDMIGTLPIDAKRTNIARAQMGEVCLEAIHGAACLGATIGTLQTRVQAIKAAQKLADLLAQVTTAMDDVVALFSFNLRPDFRYYAQTETYRQLLALTSKSVEFLIRESFDLRIEKRIVLDRDKTPIQICAEEYGTNGEDNLDGFIAWNGLEGDEVMILPQSREVVVYVEPKR
jgi:hypothetical protein